MRLNIFSKKPDISPFLSRINQFTALPDEEFTSRGDELETIFREYSLFCRSQEKEPGVSVNSRLLAALLAPSVQRPSRSCLQVLLHRLPKVPGSYRPVIVSLYKIWENSRYNPARPGTDLSRFDYGLFDLRPFELPQQLSRNEYTSLPVWRLRGNVLQVIYLDDIVIQDKGINKQQVCGRRTVTLPDPVEDVYQKVHEPFQVIRDRDSGKIIQFMTYDGDIPETYLPDDENEQATIKIRYDLPLLGEAHVYCPFLLYGYDAEKNLMSTICKVTGEKDWFIQPVPLFLVDFLSTEAGYCEKLHVPIPAELGLEEKTFTQQLPLSQYPGLEYLRRSSLINYFMSSASFPDRADQPAFTLPPVGGKQPAYSCGTVNLLAKIIQMPEYAGKPWFDSVLRLVIILENACLDLYGIYTQAELMKAIRRFSEATANSDFDSIRIEYRQTRGAK